MKNNQGLSKIFPGGERRKPRRQGRHRLRPEVLDLEHRRLLSTIVVNNPTDTPIAGEIDLRQAIQTANASGGDEAITFDGTVFAGPMTITLTGGPLALTDTTGTESITGPASGVTIDGGGLSGVFQVDPGVTASFSGLTISGGNTSGQGGGLYNDGGTVSLSDCTVSGNTSTLNRADSGGGGVATTAGGTTTLTGCTVSGNTADRDGGGLILYQGMMTLTDCTVSGNSSVNDGGGMSILAGTLTLASDTVSGNYNKNGFGGGVANLGTATLTDTIVAGNTGLYDEGWSFSSNPSPNDIYGTVAGTYNLIGTGGSGGLVAGVDGNLVGVADPLLGALGSYGGPTQTVPLLPGSPAIDAGTSAGAPSTDQRGEPRVGPVDIGAFESQGFTLAPAAGSTPQTATVGAAFNPLAFTVTANNPVEPVDGGIIQFAVNPAADGASAILLATSAVIVDGQAAVVGGPNNVDGSYTVTASSAGVAPASVDLTNAGPVFRRLAVNSTSNTLFAGPGLLSLTLAVTLANADTSGNANISFDPTAFAAPQTITLAGTPLVLSNASEPETIAGPASGVTIDGGGLSRILQVDPAVDASISRVTFADGNATEGGAIVNQGTLDLDRCLFEDNVSYSLYYLDGGAAIDNEGGATLSLTDCTLTGNSATGGGGFGGAIQNRGTASLNGCSVTGNSAPFGGAIYNSSNGILTLTGCQLDDNTAPPIDIITGSFREYGPGTGGAIYNSAGQLRLVDCTLAGNSSNFGGAIANEAYSSGTAQASLTDCALSANVAVAYQAFFGTEQPNGGAITNSAYDGAATLSLTGCTLTGNTAGTSGGNGGAIACYGYPGGGGATVSLKDCTLSGNATGGLGGAIDTRYGGLDMYNGTLTMDGCTLTGNSAGQAGGGAAIGGTATLTNCRISQNTSQDGGGVDVSGTSAASMTACVVSGNTATGEGGGLYVKGVVVYNGYYGTYSYGPASVALNSVTISGNSAAQGGGGILNAGVVTATGIVVLDNSAATGGGIDNVAGATATISDSSILANSASGDGGGIANAGTLSLTGTRLRGNTAAADGGGLYNSGTATLVYCAVTGNSAASGGGIYAAPGGSVTLTGTLVTNNKKGNIVGSVSEG